jgi:hypothetical protein
MREFCKNMLQSKSTEFVASVHREMWLKHAYFSYFNAIGKSTNHYFPKTSPIILNKGSAQIFNYMNKHIFFSMPVEVFNNLIWRGSPLSNEFKVLNALQIKKNRLNFYIPDIISTNWPNFNSFANNSEGLNNVGSFYLLVGVASEKILYYLFSFFFHLKKLLK